MDIEAPHCYFCQSKTFGTFCHSCPNQYNLLHVQTFCRTPEELMEGFVINSITCKLKNKHFKTIAVKYNNELQTKILGIVSEDILRYKRILTLLGHPLTPQNIMAKLPIYLTFS